MSCLDAVYPNLAVDDEKSKMWRARALRRYHGYVTSITSLMYSLEEGNAPLTQDTDESSGTLVVEPEHLYTVAASQFDI